ncbi:M24 family metallopeptidase [candidate division KSB1 bacterium]|nr:M24 family metallopeptidase [candidate division KSB1 bacterium]
MLKKANVRKSGKCDFPKILPVREQSNLITKLVMNRLDTVLPLAMKEAGLDMWIILCQEDDLDPIYKTMIPMDCWSPILQMLIFVDEGDGKIKRYNVSGTDTKDLYERPYIGQLEEKQWSVLLDLVNKRDPKTIGVNIGTVKWCGGGLTYNLYRQLKEKLSPKYSERLVSAEKAAARWGATLTDREINLFQHVIKIAHNIIAECFSCKTITPGVTTVDDIIWFYWQRAIDLGLDLAFRPYFSIIRNEADSIYYGRGDNIILPGDVIHCDVGIKYLRLNSDNQHLAYVLRPYETDASAGLKSLMNQTNQLQDIFMDEFRIGISGNELQQNILKRARKEGIYNPRIYSHSLGLFLHEPGPLIGLPWEQKNPLPRGETLMEHNYAFTMELSTEGSVTEWNNRNVRCGMEEPVVFTKEGCHTLNGRQTEFYLI